MDRVRLIYQDEVWMDGQNRIHRISEMEIRHAQNVYRYLLDGDRPALMLNSVLSALMCGPTPNGEMAQDALDSEMERLMQADSNPKVWLKEQPLLEALQERGWGSPEPVVPQLGPRELLVVVKVRIARDADSAPVEYDIEEALKALPYDIEIADFR